MAQQSFRGYADYMQTEAFAEGLTTLIHMRGENPTATIGAVAVPSRCHRSLLAVRFVCAAARRSRFHLRSVTACIS
ncbi:MAG: hypothetical protein JWM36_2457 [Hyphomicrobiales bacterium]|nr:hypothetical protein [Hyphomicrobiales bacterium]